MVPQVVMVLVVLQVQVDPRVTQVHLVHLVQADLQENQDQAVLQVHPDQVVQVVQVVHQVHQVHQVQSSGREQMVLLHSNMNIIIHQLPQVLLMMVI
tara:strand:+ start:357 stop:647 length:291 start_codon:yes stop_codon:yes gene_type:complete